MTKIIMIVWLLFLFTFAGLSIKQTYAFYDNTVKTESETISIGEWIYTVEWNSTTSYPTGTIVYYNNQYWIKTKNGGTGKAPSTSPPGRNFWSVYNG